MGVTYSYGTKFCITDDTDDSTLNVVQIQFITEHGDLPAITVDDSNLVDSNTDTKLVDSTSKPTAKRSVRTTTRRTPRSRARPRASTARTAGSAIGRPGYA